MNALIDGLTSFIGLNFESTVALAFGLLSLLGILLIFGRRFDFVLRVEGFGVPIALFLGLFALLLGPYGPFHLLPQSVTEIWVSLPTPLLTIIFATLLLGTPLPDVDGLIRPVLSQAMLGLFLGFGQYLVGGIVVIFLLIPWLGLDPLIGCLIEVGFEGGHGAAAVMGGIFGKLGFDGGLDLGLAMATVGLLSSTIIGSGLVVFARIKGWLSNEPEFGTSTSASSQETVSLIVQFRLLLVNLALIGIAVAFAIVLRALLRTFLIPLGGVYADVVSVFPLFPLALLGSFIIRVTIERLGLKNLISEIFHRELASIATDLLITTAIASLNIPLLRESWLPLSILSATGLIWNLAGMFLFSKYIFRKNSFERSISEFGNSTGVAASGVLLLRLSDPMNLTNTLPIFSMKQLFLQPVLSGGVITVIAPLAIINLGLMDWTLICGFLSLIFVFIAILIDSDIEILKFN